MIHAMAPRVRLSGFLMVLATAALSCALSRSAGAAVAIQDALVTGNIGGVNGGDVAISGNVAFTVTTGANVLVVQFGMAGQTNTQFATTTVKWNGVSLTKAAGVVSAASTYVYSGVYYLVNPTPAVGGNVTVTTTGREVELGIFTLSGVDTTVTPIGNQATSATGTTLPVTLSGLPANAYAVVEETNRIGSGSTNTDTLATSVGSAAQQWSGNFPAGGLCVYGGGIVSGIPAGTVTITTTFNNNTGQNRNDIAAAAFAPTIAASSLIVGLPGQTFTAGSGYTGTVTAQTAGTAFNVLEIRNVDASNNTVTSYTGTKTITWSGPANSPNATAPTYTTSVNFTNGVSTTTLATTLVKAQLTTITVTDGTVAGLASSSLTVNSGASKNVSFTVQPPAATGITLAMTPPIQVSMLDSFGNFASADNTSNVTVAIGTNPSAGTLSGTLTKTAVNGIATFSNLSINNAGTGYTLVASENINANTATSTAFNIVNYKLVFTVQPPTTTGTGALISPPIQVSVQDSTNSTIATDNTTVVTLALSANPGSSTLSGTISRTAVNGVATFNDISLNNVGTGYTLAATAVPTWTPATSSAFNIATTLARFNFNAAANVSATPSAPAAGAGYDNVAAAVTGVTVTPQVSSPTYAEIYQPAGTSTAQIFRFDCGVLGASPTVAIAIANNSFWQYSITPVSGYSISLANMTFLAERGGAGTPRGYSVRSSVDNFATDLQTADLQTYRAQIAPDTTNFTTVSINLSSVTQLQNITATNPIVFRIYGYAPGAGQSIDYDDMVLSGSVAVSLTTWTWVGNGAAGSWNDPLNWDLGTIPASGPSTTVILTNPANNNLPTTLDIPNLSIQTLTYNATTTTGFTTALGGSATNLTLTGGIAVNAAAGAHILNVPVVLSGPVTFTAASTTNPYTISGVISETGGSSNVGILGAGTVVFSNPANTYSGVTTLNTGSTLSVSTLANGGSPSGIGQSSNASTNIAFAGGTLLYTGSTVSVDRGFKTNAGGGTLSVSASGNLTLSGQCVGTNNTTFTKAGVGTLTFAGTLDNTNLRVNISGGTLVLAKTSSGSVHGVNQTGITLANNTATLQLAGTGNDQIADAIGVTNNGGIVDINGTNETISFLSGTGGTVVNSGANAVLTLNGGTGNFAGNINDSTGTIALVKSGGNTATLSGASIFSGGVTVSGGTLSVTTIADTGSSALGLVTNIVLSGGSLQYTGATTVNTTKTFTGSTGGTLDVNNAAGSLTINKPLTFATPSIIIKQGAGTLILNQTVDNTNLIFDAEAGITNLNNSGAGTHAVAGISNIANGATVKIIGTTGDQIGTGTTGFLGQINLGGGTFDLNGVSESVDRISGAGNISNSVAGASVLTVGESGGSGSFAGNIVDGGTGKTVTVNKIGTGTLTLSGFNTFTGGLNGMSGSLVVGTHLTAANPLGGGNVTLSGASLALQGVTTTTASATQGLTANFYNLTPQVAAGTGTTTFDPDFNTLANLNALTAAQTPAISVATTTGGKTTLDFSNAVYGATAPYNTNSATMAAYGFTGTGNYIARFDGYFTAATTGTYAFATTSDDGSMLWIDGNNVALVNNNLYQGATRVTANISLTAGNHLITIATYQGGGGQGLLVEYTPPGGTNTTIPNTVLLLATTTTAPSQTYTNNIAINANSTITIANSLTATVGNLAIGNSAVTLAGASGAILTTGAVTLSGNPTFNAAANTTLGLGALSDSGTATTLSVNGAGSSGTVFLSATAGNLQNGTTANVTTGTLRLGATNPLGLAAFINIPAGATLDGNAQSSNAQIHGAGTIMNALVSTGSVYPGTSTTPATLAAFGTNESTLYIGGSGTLDLSNGKFKVNVALNGGSVVSQSLNVLNGTVVLGGSSVLSLGRGSGTYPTTPINIITSTVPGSATITAPFANTLGMPTGWTLRYSSNGSPVTPGGGVTADTVSIIPTSTNVSPIKLDAFTAEPVGAGVAISWHCVSEFQNAGFQVYRQAVDESEWVRVNPALIAGRITNTDEKTYTYYDWTAPGVYRYKLESVDIDGSIDTYPTIIESVSVDAMDATNTADNTSVDSIVNSLQIEGSVMQVAAYSAAVARAEQEKTVLPVTITALNRAPSKRAAGGSNNLAQRELSTPNIEPATSNAFVAARWFTSGTLATNNYIAAKVRYTQPGVLAILQSSLPAGFDINHVAIQREGITLPILAVQNNTLYVYAQGYSDDYTNVDALFIRSTTAPTAAGNITQASDLFASAQTVNTSSPATVTVSYHDVYFDYNTAYRPYTFAPWFSNQYLTNGTDQKFTLMTPLASHGSASLTVTLWSLTGGDSASPDHALQVMVNGQSAGQAQWTGGQQMMQLTFQIPSGALNAGSNQINLVTPELPGVASQICFVHSLTMNYTRTLDASQPLTVINSGGAANLCELLNLPGPNAWIVDTRFPSRAALVPYQSQQQVDGTYKIRFDAAIGGARHYLVVPFGQENNPVSIAKCSVKPISKMPYLATGPNQFGAGVQPLLMKHSKEALKGQFVDQEQLFNYYNYGRYGPSGIQSAVRSTHPKYLLLVGRTTYDYLNYSGANVDPLCPAFLVPTTYWAQATSDSMFGDLGRGYPEVAVGRLPVNNTTELAGAVRHILTYSGAPVSGIRVHAVADQADPAAGNFPSQAAGIAQAVPELSWQENYLGVTYQSSPEVTAAMTMAANGGADWLIYVGHGNAIGLGNESPRILDTNTVQNWTGNTVLLQSTCTGNWMAKDIQNYKSIAIQALTQPQGGISASIGTSTYMSSSHAVAFMAQLMKTANTRGMRWGDALMKTQQWASQQGQTYYDDLNRTEQIFGDPAMPVFGAGAGANSTTNSSGKIGTAPATGSF